MMFSMWEKFQQGRFWIQKPKSKKEKISGTLNTWEKNLCQNAVFLPITLVQDLAFDNCQYL